MTGRDNFNLFAAASGNAAANALCGVSINASRSERITEECEQVARKPHNEANPTKHQVRYVRPSTHGDVERRIHDVRGARLDRADKKNDRSSAQPQNG